MSPGLHRSHLSQTRINKHETDDNDNIAPYEARGTSIGEDKSQQSAFVVSLALQKCTASRMV